MKTLSKIALGSVIAAAGATAQAGQLQTPNGTGTTVGNANLLFYVVDEGSHTSYTLQLVGQSVNGGNVNVNGVATATGSGYFTSADAQSSSTQGVVNKINGDTGFTYALGADTGLQKFISGATGPVVWGVIAGAYAPTGTDTQGNNLVITTGTDTSIVGVGDGALDTLTGQKLALDYTTLNTNYATTKDAFAAAPGTPKGVFGTTQSKAGTGLTLYGNAVAQGQAIDSASSAVSLYGLASNGTNAGTAIAFNLGSIYFDGTTLSFSGNQQSVPLPAAAWLFGSGLLGLVGIGRRRMNGVAAVAA